MSPEPLRILLVDDDDTFRRILGDTLSDEGFAVETAPNGLEGLEKMNRQTFDLAIVDLRMPEMDGLSLLAELKRRHPAVIPLVLTGYGTVSAAVTAVHSGAFDMVSKAAPVDEIISTLRRAVEERRRSRPEPALGDALFGRQAFFGIVGKSAPMQKVFAVTRRFQASAQPVLVCGETGTGKELVARALHAGGHRRENPLVAVNCALLRENFVEDELFGHVHGAFTGASHAKQGLFALADGGTLHIDEIGEMPETTQAALLRVLDTNTFRPIGSAGEVRIDVRVVASTNREMDRLVANGGFRRDLFHRLCVCRIDLPPLRDRADDIPFLINHFLDSSPAARRIRVSDSAMAALMRHDWPGNVRELLNTLEQASLLAEEGVVEPGHLDLRPHPSIAHGQVPTVDQEVTLEQLERIHIERLLQREGGNVTQVATILGVDPTTVRRKLRRWNIVRS